MAVPAAAADGPPKIDPPRINCGVTRTDNGPLSLVVHNLEPLFGPQLAGTLHELNCGLVTNIEVSLGLMPRWTPG
jgi:hypothetical protein